MGELWTEEFTSVQSVRNNFSYYVFTRRLFLFILKAVRYLHCYTFNPSTHTLTAGPAIQTLAHDLAMQIILLLHHKVKKQLEV